MWRACLAPGSFRKQQTFRKSEFELLECCVMDEHFEQLKYLIKNGVNAIMPSLMMFGVDGDEVL